MPLLNELSIPKIEDQIPQCVNREISIDENKISSDTIETISHMAVNDAMVEIIAQVVSYLTGIVVMLIVDMFCFMGIAMIIGIISQILVYVGIRNPREIQSKSDFKSKELALYNELKDKIRSALCKEDTRERFALTPKEV